jgi:hypothetical protein
MPVVGVRGGERPNEALAAQSSLNVSIFSNVQGIIIVYEFMVSHLPVDYDSGRNQS